MNGRRPGATTRYVAADDITRGQLVELASDGRLVWAASLGTRRCIGLAVHDADAGAAVRVTPLAGNTFSVRAAAAIDAGERVQVGRAGTVSPAASDDRTIGTAVATVGPGGLCTFTGAATEANA